MFISEPDWFIQKRREDKKLTNLNNRIPYTNEEDKMIQSMFRNGKSDDEIGVVLNRSGKAIKSRRGILGLSKNTYQDYEIDILKEYSDKLTIYELAKKLPLRKPKGIAYKCSELGIPYHLSTNKCNKD